LLRQVADGVLIHESEFCQSNAVVVHGRAGVLLIDPGVHGYEMACLANDLSDSRPHRCRRLLEHPHWDHSDARLGPSATYGDWLPGVHAGQLQRLARRSERDDPANLLAHDKAD